MADGADGRDDTGHFSSQLGSALAIACRDNADHEVVAERFRAWEELSLQSPLTGRYMGLDLTAPSGWSPPAGSGGTSPPRVPRRFSSSVRPVIR